jgi:phosphatidylglycerol:prolipoprotein diacylglycerol transferase
MLCGHYCPGKKVESQYFIHNFDPIIFEFDLFGMHLRVAWYGLMYVIGFIAGFYLVKYLWRKGFIEFPDNDSLGDLMTYMFAGVIIGGRLGHVLFYDPIAYFSDPVTILFVWEGGMASHGGMIGVVIATYLYARRYQVSLRRLWDALAMAAPIGLGLGRFGNFINGEMVGKVTDVSWAVIFQHIDNLPRHPVQVYQSLTDGPILFLILWFWPRERFAYGTHGAVFLISYGILRIITEYFRKIDPASLGYHFGLFTTGQLLSLLMVGIGALLFWYFNRSAESELTAS